MSSELVPTATGHQLSVPNMPVLPTLAGIIAPAAAPPVLPGLPAHVGLTQVAEFHRAGRFGVEAVVQVPALDVEIMNEMAKVVVVAHTIASRVSASLVAAARSSTVASGTTAMEVRQEHVTPGVPTAAEVMAEMGQFVVILHRLAERINHFQGFLESTRNIIRQCRTLATDLQGEIEAHKMMGAWAPSATNREIIRQCRLLATELQEEIEIRKGPQG